MIHAYIFFAALVAPGPLVEKLQASYDTLASLHARFEQTYRSKRFSEVKTSGTVVMVKPGKMRWDYDQPKGRVFVSDGVQITLYDPEDRQALVTPLPKNQALPVAFGFLWGKGKLEKSFEISLFSQTSKEATLKLHPKESIPNVSEVYLTVSLNEPVLVTSSRVIDPLGGETVLTFLNVKLNSAVEANLFAYKPPRGTPVVVVNADKIKH